jgi:hypothetical protein
MRILPLLFLAATAVLPLSAQRIEPIPGRWLVTLRDPGYSLQPLRDAIRGRQPAAAVDAVVAELDRRAREDQRELVALVARLGGRVTQQWWIVDAFACELPEAAVAELRAHRRVLRIDPDAIVFPALGRSLDAANHNARAAHALGVLGAGVTAAIVDAGIDVDMGGSGRPHAAYFVDGDPTNRTGGGIGGSRLLAAVQVGAQPVDDRIGHGTGVAGVVAGERWTSDPHNARGHAPAAALVAYSIHDFPNGGASFTSITAGWQRVAAERARYAIGTANNSYGGSPSANHPSQQALDAVVHFGDVMVVVAAGNSAADTSGSQSCANGLVAGATIQDQRQMSVVSSRGPLNGDPQRFYPDLVANGIGIESPLLDSEVPGAWYSGCCTSFASPQVCGAATLYRSARPAADALETKAAILAATEDVSAKNPNPPYNSRNAYGLGYLRDDRLIALARGDGMLASVTLTNAVPDQTLRFGVRAGRRYAVAIAWHRTQLASIAWSNVDLVVRSGTQVLGSSTSPRNLYERVAFQAPADGSVEIDVRGVSLDVPRVDVALAAIDETAPYSVATVAAFGTGCAGGGAELEVGLVAPKAFDRAFGNSADTTFLGTNSIRWQQIVDAAELPAAATLHGFTLRPDDRVGPDALDREFMKAFRIDVAIDAGYAPHGPGAMQTTFAANISGTPVPVIARKRMSLADHPGIARGAGDWVFRFPFDQPFRWAPQAGQHLLLDIRRWSVSTGGLPTNFTLDLTVFNPVLAYVAASDPAATTGNYFRSQGLILGLLTAKTPALPLLGAPRGPNLGLTHALELAQARPASVAILLLGASDRLWGTIPLPLDLTGLGAPGCRLLCSPDLGAFVPIDALGAARLSIPVPADRAFVDLDLFHQALVLDPGNNTLGLATSNGLRTRVGG